MPFLQIRELIDPESQLRKLVRMVKVLVCKFQFHQ